LIARRSLRSTLAARCCCSSRPTECRPASPIRSCSGSPASSGTPRGRIASRPRRWASCATEAPGARELPHGVPQQLAWWYLVKPGRRDESWTTCRRNCAPPCRSLMTGSPITSSAWFRREGRESKLLVCSIDLKKDLDSNPVARQMLHSLLDYMGARVSTLRLPSAKTTSGGCWSGRRPQSSSRSGPRSSRPTAKTAPKITSVRRRLTATPGPSGTRAGSQALTPCLTISRLIWDAT